MSAKRRSFPFSAIVGQDDLRLCLILCAIDQSIGGVLIRGDKGTAKSTAARGLAELLPPIDVRYNKKLNAWDPYNRGDLESDQDLADHLDRINADTADEQERQMIKRQAMEACLNTMREHLLEFLADHPQATYEEWICQLHPDNINTQLEGLTHTPMIDHRFYVADSDHRLLWNEHLNDLNDETNMTPVRHFVAARTFAKKPSNIVDFSEEASNSNPGEQNLIALDGTTPEAKPTSGETQQNAVGDLLSF